MVERDEEALHHEFLTATAKAALAAGALSLWDVVAKCHGADPLTVRAILTGLDCDAQDVASVQSSSAPRDEDGAIVTTLPVPHPLAFEWRFTRGGADAILASTPRGASMDLLCLGATTVAIAAAQEKWTGEITGVDDSSPVLEAARGLGTRAVFITSDASEATGITGDVVVIDPPWYLDDMRRFLHAAVGACRLGGHVLAVVPGIGTRPQARREREELLSLAESLGMDLREAQPQLVSYETPFFEGNAFRAAGIATVPRSWRRGDLWLLQRRRVAALPALARDTPEPTWRELGIDHMRVRFRVTRRHCGDTRLLSLCDGDVLPTVSRRDPRRESVDVWTSGNRVFGCEDPRTLFAGMHAVLSGSNPSVASEQALGRPLTRTEWTACEDSRTRLITLAAIEFNEYRQHHQYT